MSSRFDSHHLLLASALLLATLWPFLSVAGTETARSCTPREGVIVGGVKARACASSTLQPSARYTAKNAFDGKASTAWVEGAKGIGLDEFLVLEFPQPVTLSGFLLLPGYVKSVKAFLQNHVPRRVVLDVDGRQVGEYELLYHVNMDEEDETQTCHLTGDPLNLTPRLVVFRQPLQGRRLQLTVKSQVRSARTKYSDLAISEFLPLLEGGPAPSAWPVVKVASERLRHYARTGTLEGSWLAVDGEVADVLAPRGDIGADWMQAGIREEFLRLGAEPSRQPLENFSRVAQNGLLDTPVAIWSHEGHHHLIGSRLFSVGDGEWTELYPALTFGPHLELQHASVLLSADGAPGCRDVLPLPAP